jgi:predicted transcriptional regulator
MRLEIIIPDSTRADVKARLTSLTQRLSEKPELVDEIELVDDAAVQAMFTPDRLAHIDRALAEVEGGNFFTAAQVEEHFAQKATSWTQSPNH